MQPLPTIPVRSNQLVTDASPFADGAATTTSGFWSISFGLALFGIFILYNRIFDYAFSGYEIPRISLALIILFYFVSGRPIVGLKSASGKFMLGLVLWTTVTLATSVWKSNSLAPYEQFMIGAITFALAASLPVTLKNVTTLMNTLAFAGLGIVLMTVPFGNQRAGRLCLTNGNLGDPNYFGMAVLVTVPLFWNMAKSSESYFVKILAWSCTVPLFWALARSGSRGAMLGLAVMIFVMFFVSPVVTKLLLVGGTVLGLLVAIAVMPAYLRTRYLTFFETDTSVNAPPTPVSGTAGGEPEIESSADRLKSDVDSAVERQRLLMESIQLTLEHPLFGVGPGNFAEAVWAESEQAGVAHNVWLVTHNAYTQISSETGFPGFICFIGLILGGLSGLVSVLRRAKVDGVKPDPRAYFTAKYLLISMSALSVCIFFLAVANEIPIYLWAGIATSVKRAYDEKQVDATGMEEQPQQVVAPPKAKPVTAPTYAKVQNQLPQREAPGVEGRAVRFNRFR